MKKFYVSASSLVDEFMKYHEDSANYNANPGGFDRMYDILSQYGDENEDVNIVFERAPRNVQEKMIDLIKPQYRIGTREYCRKLYYDALDCNIENAGSEYCKGVVDAIEALFEGGWLSEQEFRTDL